MTRAEFAIALPWMIATFVSLLLARGFYRMARTAMDNFDEMKGIVDRLLADRMPDEDEDVSDV